MSDQYRWHFPKSGRFLSKLTKEQELLLKVFGGEDEYSEPCKVETRCGILVEYGRLMEFDVYQADKGMNPELWCPYCFGA